MSVDSLPGVYEKSKLVVLRNRYCIVNAMANETLLVRQEGTPETQNFILEVPPLGKAFFHWFKTSGVGVSGSYPERVLVKFKNTSNWALGGFPINAVGGVAVWLPGNSKGAKSGAKNGEWNDAKKFVTAHVEVRLMMSMKTVR